MTNQARFALALLLANGLWACGGEELANGDVGDDSDEASVVSEVTARVGGQARVTANSGLNLRTRPSTSASIILTMPSGSIVDVVAASSGWFSVNYRGTTGWAFGDYLEAYSSGGGSSGGGSTGGGSSGSATIDAMIERARSGVGFSYWWGGGCWDPNSTSHGACYGSCPNCSHSGRWGADCSGYISKIWQIPGPEALTHCSHPYTTYTFYDTSSHWRTVSRSNAQKGDAFVRRGHIFLFDSGDAWGTIRAYEARGCSYGIVHNNRTADSSYKVIRRDGV